MVYKQLAALSKKGGAIVPDPIFAPFANSVTKKDKKRKKDSDRTESTKKKRKSSPTRKSKGKKWVIGM